MIIKFYDATQTGQRKKKSTVDYRFCNVAQSSDVKYLFYMLGIETPHKERHLMHEPQHRSPRISWKPAHF